jgi:hypothetical protein
MKNLTQEDIAKKTAVVESMISVVVRGARTEIHVDAMGGIGGGHSISLPTMVWREFCRRQVKFPPPLPMKEKS